MYPVLDVSCSVGAAVVGVPDGALDGSSVASVGLTDGIFVGGSVALVGDPVGAVVTAVGDAVAQ